MSPWAIRLGIIILTVTGIAVWFLNQPDPAVLSREDACKSWGITDSQVLATCRESAEQKDAAIESILRPKIEMEVAEFNQGLSRLASGRTVAKDADYPSARIEDVAKITGGEMGFKSREELKSFAAKGRRFKLTGVIVSHETDLDDPPDERQTEPRYFTLVTETPPPESPPRDIEAEAKALANWSMTSAVNLDIESLNRFERQFIVDHCKFLFSVALQAQRTFDSVAGHGCRATVLGHVDEIVGRSLTWGTGGISYVGLVAEQIDIQPLNLNTAIDAR
jgi:hypothetical protein